MNKNSHDNSTNILTSPGFNQDDGVKGQGSEQISATMPVRPVDDLSVGSVDEGPQAAGKTLFSDRWETSKEVSDQCPSSPVTEPETAAGMLRHQLSGENGTGDEGKRETTLAVSLDPRLRILLSGPGRLVSDCARELGQALAPHGIYRHAGSAASYRRDLKVLEPVSPARFCSLIEDYIIPIKAKESGEVEQSMASGEAKKILISRHFLENLREVERMNTVRLPVARGDGTIELLPEGYDKESRILTVQDGVCYRTDVPLAEAKAFLDDLFGEFPFADEGRSRAVAIAAMLTLFSLELMPPRTIQPVFLYRGNVPGLGKGLLAQAAMIPRLDYAPAGAMPRSEEEMRKLLFATALEGRPVVFLDNVTGRLASPSLEGFVTSSTYTGRQLNHSRTVVCPKNTVVFVTGNNLTLNEDMARRTMIAELYLAGDPGERVIKNHLDENRLRELRPGILAALFATVREWAQAGKPAPAKLNPNFEGWSRTVGGIVEHAGYGSVTTLPTAAAAEDPGQAEMVVLVHQMYQERQTEGLKFKDVCAVARAKGLFALLLPQGGKASDRVENTAFSRFLAGQEQRMFPDGLRFIILGRGHARRYAVRRLEVGAVEA